MDYLLECLAFFDSSSFVTVDSAGSIKDSDYLLCEVSQTCLHVYLTGCGFLRFLSSVPKMRVSFHI